MQWRIRRYYHLVAYHRSRPVRHPTPHPQEYGLLHTMLKPPWGSISLAKTPECYLRCWVCECDNIISNWSDVLGRCDWYWIVMNLVSSGLWPLVVSLGKIGLNSTCANGVQWRMKYQHNNQPKHHNFHIILTFHLHRPTRSIQSTPLKQQPCLQTSFTRWWITRWNRQCISVPLVK